VTAHVEVYLTCNRTTGPKRVCGAHYPPVGPYTIRDVEVLRRMAARDGWLSTAIGDFCADHRIAPSLEPTQIAETEHIA
jgi:hypothetical protein